MVKKRVLEIPRRGVCWLFGMTYTTNYRSVQVGYGVSHSFNGLVGFVWGEGEGVCYVYLLIARNSYLFEKDVKSRPIVSIPGCKQLAC